MRVQSQGADQIREAMLRLSEVASQTSVSLREFNSATDHLREAVGGLKDEVSRFQLGAADAVVSPAGHGRLIRDRRRERPSGRGQAMLLLTFQAAGQLYAVDAARIVEVVPRVNLRPLPHAQAFLAGVFEYRGDVVPVVDLGVLLGAGPAPDRLSTRIILVDRAAVAPRKPADDRDAEASSEPSPSVPTRPDDRSWA